jgi:hypothetical protein
MGLVLDHFYGDQLEGVDLALAVLDEIDVAIGALAESALVLVFVQEHKIFLDY